MKRFLITLSVLVLVASAATAQVSQGTFTVTGNVSYSSQNEEFDLIAGPVDSELSTFSISPQVGYFISDNFEVGLGLSYTSFDAGSDENTSEFQFGAFGNYYLFVGENFAFVPGVGVAFGTVDLGDDDIDVSTFSLGVNLGVKYFVAPKWSIDANLGGLTYSSITIEGSGNELTNSNLDFGIFNNGNMTLGLTWYVNR